MGSVSTTPIITTVEPLVPLIIKNYPPIPCPRNISSPDFRHFTVKSKSLVLNNIDAVAQVCNGVFCDGQPKGDCPCLEVDNRKTSWVLTANIESDISLLNLDRRELSIYFHLVVRMQIQIKEILTYWTSLTMWKSACNM